MSLFDSAKSGLHSVKKIAAAAIDGLDNEEVRSSIADIKENATEIGGQLRNAGKSVVDQVRTEVTQSAINNTQAQQHDTEQEHGDEEKRESRRSQSLQEKSLEEMGLPPAASRSPKSKGRSKQRIDEDVPKNKVVHHHHRIAIFAACVFIAAAFFVVLLGAGSTNNEEVAVDTAQPYYFDVAVKDNLLFSRYDVAISIDGKQLGKVEHGGFASYKTELDDGSHTLEVASADDSSVNGTLDVESQSDQAPLFEVSCYSDRVEINELSDDEADERRAEAYKVIANQAGEKAAEIIQQLDETNYRSAGFTIKCMDGNENLEVSDAKDYVIVEGDANAADHTITLKLESPDDALADQLLSIANQPGESADTVISQLEDAGYQDGGYSLTCFENDSQLDSFSQEKYAVVAGDVDKKTKSIRLDLISTESATPAVDKNMALRAAVVAMTNLYATDVFTADGSSYDASKFHSYADTSGYYMDVLQEGNWTGVDADTWHVDDLQLKASSGLYVALTSDVSFDGTNYVLSAVTAKCGNSVEAAEKGTGGVDTLEPRETTPYLTVSQTLIADDRSAGQSQSNGVQDADASSNTSSSDAWDDEREAQQLFESYGEILYPYGFKCHWILDLVACEPQGDGTYYIKVGVTITNEYGTKMDAYAQGIAGNGNVVDFYVG